MKQFADRQTVIDRLKAGWVLQFCSGIRSDGWWWLRETPAKPHAIYVRAVTARSVVRHLGLVADTSDWRHRTYKWREPTKITL